MKILAAGDSYMPRRYFEQGSRRSSRHTTRVLPDRRSAYSRSTISGVRIPRRNRSYAAGTTAHTGSWGLVEVGARHANVNPPARTRAHARASGQGQGMPPPSNRSCGWGLEPRAPASRTPTSSSRAHARAREDGYPPPFRRADHGGAWSRDRGYVRPTSTTRPSGTSGSTRRRSRRCFARSPRLSTERHTG